MSTIVFPSDPSDGMIFEASPGLFFQYRASDNCWVRIDGSDALPLASPLQDGLMTSEDLQKLMDLVLPPPQATLAGEDCNLIFRQGRIGLYSSDGSLVIEPSLDLISQNASANTERPWDLHRNTAGINFGVNLNQFLDEVKERGNFVEAQLVGDQGQTGDRGEPGRDQLDTGPTGAIGLSGANSPFDGAIIEESLNLQAETTDDPRAVVRVTTEEVSEDENYLVFTRANIGNPTACPSEVLPRPISSPWLLVIQRGITTIRKLTKLTDDCGVPCAICTSAIYYVNVDPLLQAIFDRFKLQITNLKKAKEDLVASWLKSMVYLFNQQKAALCCALENCKSRTRNVGTRKYIESQRIQAALGNFSLVVDGAEDKLDVDLDEFKECVGKPTAQPQQSQYITENLGAGCGDWLYEVTVDASVHNKDPRNAGNQACLMLTLPRGSYYAQVLSCCAQLGGGGAVAQGALGNTAEGQFMLDSKAFDGEPVPGQPGFIYVTDPRTGQRVVMDVTGIGDRNQLDFQSRRGHNPDLAHTGRVAILYEYGIPELTGPFSSGEVATEQRVVQVPDLGRFSDFSAARSAYLGLTVRFTHNGGST
jgi:hypothetical protein